MTETGVVIGARFLNPGSRLVVRNVCGTISGFDLARIENRNALTSYVVDRAVASR